MRAASTATDVLPTPALNGRFICGHRDLSPDLNGNGEIEPEEWVKACPCFDVTKEWR